jgi:hypothetical protein
MSVILKQLHNFSQPIKLPPLPHNVKFFHIVYNAKQIPRHSLFSCRADLIRQTEAHHASSPYLYIVKRIAPSKKKYQYFEVIKTFSTESTQRLTAARYERSFCSRKFASSIDIFSMANLYNPDRQFIILD